MADSNILPQLSGFYKMDFAQGSYFYGRSAFWGAGQTSYIKPPAEDVDAFEVMQNVMPPSFGGLTTRWGYGSFVTPTYAARRLFAYYNDTTTTRGVLAVMTNGTSIVAGGWNESGQQIWNNYSLPSGVASAAANFYGVSSRNYFYFLDGQAADQKKWTLYGSALPGSWAASTNESAGTYIVDSNGNVQKCTTAGTTGGSAPTWATQNQSTTTDNTVTWTCYGPNVQTWGIAPAATAISVGSPSAGAITLNSGRFYYAVFKNAVTGHFSDLNPVSASTGPITNQNIPLVNIPVSTDQQVSHVAILATADGGDETTLYLLTTLTNGTTTYTDSTTEQTLLLSSVYQNTDSAGVPHGVADNSLPPTANGIVITHQGRLWILDGGNLYFSKSLSDLTTSDGIITGRFEEAWPGTYQMVISKEAELGTALFSDGVTLYIGTSRAVRRVVGSDPTSFSEPEIVFNEAGVFNQDVFKRIFVEGQPVGMMWLTPDGRVIQSDFNTYRDVGTPVQDILNTINPAGSPYATAVSWGPYDFYVLAVPTGSNTVPNELLIYDLRHGRWIVWSLYDTAINAVFFDIPNQSSPLFLFSDNSTGIWSFNSTYTVDRSGSTNAAIAGALKSCWQHLGDPILRKWLNAVEISASSSSFTGTIEGASIDSDFTTPNTIVNAASPTTGPFGEFKYFTASAATKDRFYRLTLNWTGPFTLAGWAFEAVPINRF